MKIHYGREDDQYYTEVQLFATATSDLTVPEKLLEYLNAVGIEYTVEPPDATIPPCVFTVPDILDVPAAILWADSMRLRENMDTGMGTIIFEPNPESTKEWPF